MFGSHTRKDSRVLGRRAQFVVRHRLHLDTRMDRIALLHNAERTRDSRCRNLVVARDHHRTNTRRTALSHSRFDLLTRRVDHTHHTHEGQPALNACRLNHSGQFVDIFIRHRQHTQRATTHIEIGRIQSLTILIGQRTLLATHVNLLAAGQHLVHRALHSHQ